MNSIAPLGEIDPQAPQNGEDARRRAESFGMREGREDDGETYCYVVAATGELDVRDVRRRHDSVDAVVPLFLNAPPTDWNVLLLDNAAWHNDAFRHPYFYATMALGAIALLGLFWMLTPWFPWI